MVDIEMTKIDVEKKKAEALENLSNKTAKEEDGGLGYIKEIEALNELKRQGIITEEEFEEKKKKLLN